jgi:hypothetical protein
VKLVSRVFLILLAVTVLLAWSGGRAPAMDFAGGVGRITGDVASAVLGFVDSLAERRPDTVDSQSTTDSRSVTGSSSDRSRRSSSSTSSTTEGSGVGGAGSPEIDETTGRPVGTEPPHTRGSLPLGS